MKYVFCALKYGRLLVKKYISEDVMHRVWLVEVLVIICVEQTKYLENISRLLDTYLLAWCDLILARLALF